MGDVLTSSMFNQTTVTAALLNPLQSRAVRYSCVDAVGSEEEAIATALTDLPSFMTIAGVDVPRSNVMVRRFSASKAMVIGQYRHETFGGTADDPFAIVQRRTWTDYEPWWTIDADGLEDVNEEYDPQLRRLMPRQWQRPLTVSEMTVDVVLEDPIFYTVSAFHDTLNANPFTADGKIYAPHTLWFTSPSQRSVLTVGVNGVHQVRYRFLYCGENGWERQTLIGDNLVATELKFPAVAWIDFPTT